MMNFTLKKKILPSLMAAALVSGVAFSGSANAIHLAEDGIGQVLMGPMYLANFGYTTKYAIVNTHTDVAVKAKVVLRSQFTSAEVLDFICYLTPADVCRFEVVNINGQAFFRSDDDSVRSADGTTFASVTPVQQQLFDQNLGSGDNNEIGHMEVIGVYAARGDVRTPRGTVTVFRGMSKFELAKIFDTSRATLSTLNGAEVPAVGRTVGAVCQTNPSALVTPAANTATAALPSTGVPCATGNVAPSGVIRSTDPTWVQLTGYAEMVSSADRIGHRLAALAGEIWDNVPPYDTYTVATNTRGIFGGAFDGRVISNPNFDAVGGAGAPETAIGFGFGGVNRGLQVGEYENIIEIEHALAVTNLMATYEDDSATKPVAGINRTRLLVTFPTKYRHLRDVCNSGATGTPYFPPFQPRGEINYGLDAYDNQENNRQIIGIPFSGGPSQPISSLPFEVNYYIPGWPETTRDANGRVTSGTNFESGWFNMTLQPRTGCSYNGVPTLSFAHKYFERTSGTFSSSWFVPVSHTPDLVNRNFPPHAP